MFQPPTTLFLAFVYASMCLSIGSTYRLPTCLFVSLSAFTSWLPYVNRFQTSYPFIPLLKFHPLVSFLVIIPSSFIPEINSNAIPSTSFVKSFLLGFDFIQMFQGVALRRANPHPPPPKPFDQISKWLPANQFELYY